MYLPEETEEEDFESLLAVHKIEQQYGQFGRQPTRILRLEGLKVPEEDGVESSSTVKKKKKDLKRKVEAFFTRFGGEVTYINLNPMRDEWCTSFVHFSIPDDAKKAKEELEKEQKEGGTKGDKAVEVLLDVNVTYERPRTRFLELPISVRHKSSRHLWVGSIDDNVITPDILARIFSSYGTLTDSPHVNVGQQQGFVDFRSVYEAVDAMYNLNGVYLARMGIVIKFGRQERGRELWVGGLSKNITKYDLQQAFEPWAGEEGIREINLNEGMGSATIRFDDEDSAQEALDMLQGQQIKDSSIIIDYSPQIPLPIKVDAPVVRRYLSSVPISFRRARALPPMVSPFTANKPIVPNNNLTSSITGIW
eukprot:CAMPEP_0174252444 /NCGR_PEP_ID=MMETSP0439-20130205/1911_1 /TAXON_ID=0 /ORGANISM="Stereomyxa ramosa, Strain Chinc5" /LENGTH=363 /DNA_ID=CAMNT_0015332979 /DNA_START=6 /DNA_END=1095 /DNA_ORIENTATION=-